MAVIDGAIMYMGLLIVAVRGGCSQEAARAPAKFSRSETVGVICPEARFATMNEKTKAVEVPSPEAGTAEVLNCKIPEIESQKIALEFEKEAAYEKVTDTEVEVLPVKPDKASDGLQDEKRGMFTTRLTEI